MKRKSGREKRMEYLFQINPVLNSGAEVIIYGIGEEQKRIFFALLQQNISVTAFCLKKMQKTRMKEVFGKKICTLQELSEKHADAYVILSASDACNDDNLLKEIGIRNIVVENITAENMGVLVENDD